jgi:hypothetical protein
MKKTVTLNSLIKAKNDLELFIKIDEMKRLKQLFDPTLDIKDLNSKIESKEDQLIIIKEAIQFANTNTNDESGKSLNYSIYQLSKYNRFKANLLTMKNRLDTDKQFGDNSDAIKSKLLTDIRELDVLIEKETDKKVKSDHESAKRKLKRSLSKSTLPTKSTTASLKEIVVSDIKQVEDKINSIKANLTKYNSSTTVEVDISPEFELIVK